MDEVAKTLTSAVYLANAAATAGLSRSGAYLPMGEGTRRGMRRALVAAGVEHADQTEALYFYPSEYAAAASLLLDGAE